LYPTLQDSRNEEGFSCVLNCECATQWVRIESYHAGRNRSFSH